MAAVGEKNLLRLCKLDQLSSLRSIVIQATMEQADTKRVAGARSTARHYRLTACLRILGIQGWQQIEEDYARHADAADVAKACLDAHQQRHPEDRDWISESLTDLAVWAQSPFEDFAIYNHASHLHCGDDASGDV